jgi:hypothetical protein
MMEENSNWKTLVLVIGGAAGLLTGLAAAFILIRKREASEGQLSINSGEGFKIGMGIVGLLKQISESGTRR